MSTEGHCTSANLKELTHVDESQLASVFLLEEREALIRELCQQNPELLVQHMSLQADVVKLTQQLMTVQSGQNAPVKLQMHQ